MSSNIGELFKGFLNTKEKWENLIKGSKLRLIIVAVSLIVIFSGISYLTIFLLNIIIKEAGNILSRNFNTFVISNLITLFITFLIISTSLFFIFSRFKRLKNKRFLVLTGCTMFFIFIFGYFAIDRFVGNPPLTLNLFDGSNVIQGTIECKGSSGPLLVNDKIFCRINLQNKKNLVSSQEEIWVTSFLNNGSYIQDIINNTNNYFISRPNVTYLSFGVFEKYSNSIEWKTFNVGYPFSFLTQEQFKNNSDRFIGLLIALIAAVFLSIPSMMINLRELWGR